MLSLHQLSYQIGQHQILRQAEGAVESGEVVALVGPNGAGKSTLADIICGFQKPSSGQVRLAGANITGEKPYIIARWGVARLFQSSHLAWNLTAKNNVLSALTAIKDSDERPVDRNEVAMAILKRVGLADRSENIARHLSFGQQRLLALARVLARPAKALVLDEPFSGLKGVALEKIMKIIGEEADSGKAILVIDHLLSALRDLRCRFWYLAHGHLAEFSAFAPLTESGLFRSGYGTATRTRPEVRVSRVPAEQSLAHTYTKPLCRVLGKIGYNGTTVIEEVDFVAHSHEVIAIIGLNGSGKSTLLRTISGVSKILEGRVEIQGEDVTSMPIYERIRKGLRSIPQDHRLFRKLSMRDNWRLATAVLDRHKGMDTMPAFLVKTSLGKRAAGTFSGGEQAQSALMMIDNGPWSVMLLDEPTTGLDSSAKDTLLSTINDWRGQGKSIVFVEHDFDFVISAASRCYIATLNGLLPIDLNMVSTGHALLERVLLQSWTT